MIMVGCCGYPLSMKKYYETFSLVELNNTFYQYPKANTVERWRNTAPSDFEFTVKAHQDISHKHRLKLNQACMEAFDRMKEICTTLKARILLIQTPASFSPEKLDDAIKFFHKVERENLALDWETRGEAWNQPETRRRLAQELSEANVSHVTDPFAVAPAFATETAYFRLHGLGERMYYYQYSDNELRRLHENALSFQETRKRVYVLFNNLAMFDDAVRLQHFLKHDRFPSITSTVGLNSVQEVVSKTRYPATKATLIKRLGWRLVELQKGEQVQLQALMRELSAKNYESAEQVIGELEKKLQSH